jgi:hypothetical protein
MNRSHISRRLLQVAVCLSAANALLGGGLYLWRGVQGLSVFTPTPLAVDPTDSIWSTVDFMFRALAGIWFVLGLMFAYLVPSIEKHSAWFAFACLAVFAMGVGRGLSAMAFVEAPANSIGAMIGELVVPPLLIFWQRHVARTFAFPAPPR